MRTTKSATHDKGSADEPPTRQRSLLQITWSIVAAFCGVQVDATLDEDDRQIEEHGFMPYIIIGIALTLLFMGAIFGVVQLILHYAT